MSNNNNTTNLNNEDEQPSCSNQSQALDMGIPSTSGTVSSNAPTTVPVLPRRRVTDTDRPAGQECRCQALARQLDEDFQFETLEEEEEEVMEMPPPQIPGRDHPASSPAAIAGYRYRTAG